MSVHMVSLKSFYDGEMEHRARRALGKERADRVRAFTDHLLRQRGEGTSRGWVRRRDSFDAAWSMSTLMHLPATGSVRRFESLGVWFAWVGSSRSASGDIRPIAGGPAATDATSSTIRTSNSSTISGTLGRLSPSIPGTGSTTVATINGPGL